jgi:hypothetical protein
LKTITELSGILLEISYRRHVSYRILTGEEQKNKREKKNQIEKFIKSNRILCIAVSIIYD